ncbi:MAG: hypothetical protein IJX98_05360 [Clostridia bacterium]|nr:hypothetical protein [Clostridia bacterium]
MIDFHSHILPGLDDGAKDTETSAAMLDESVRQGVKTIVCTPHYYGKRSSPAQFKEKRQRAYEKLAPYCPDGVQLRLGAEVYFTTDSVVCHEDLALLAIEDTRYILLELPFLKSFSNRLLNKLSEFIYETGLTPVLAHIERYRAVLENPSVLYEFQQMGCLFQLNAEAFSLKPTQGFAKTMLSKGLVSAFGSDMHNNDDRAPNLKTLFDSLQGQETLVQSVFERSGAILNDEQISVQPKKVRKFFGKFF